MSYKDGTIKEVRKVRWDELWHVVYTIGTTRETYDRVCETEALEIIRKHLS